jgi:hypothetical protein
MRLAQRPDMELPIPESRPLIGDVEPIQGVSSGLGKDPSRDEEIILTLRERLRDRNPSNLPVTGGRRAGDKRASNEEDKYEPQRISRKICWQYDNTARKVPLLRRHYI